MVKPRKIIHYNPPISIEGSWMIGLTDLEVYNSIFNKNTTNNKLKPYKFPQEKVGGYSYTKVRDEIESDLDVSEITATDIQDDKIGPNVIEQYTDQVTKRMKDEQ